MLYDGELDHQHQNLENEVANTRRDLAGANARLVEVDNELGSVGATLSTTRRALVELDDALTALRAEHAAFRQRAEAEFARLAGETVTVEQATPVAVDAAELAVPGTGLANPAHFVQYAVRTPDQIRVYGDQSWVKSGDAAAGHPGADTVVRDIRVSYGPWRPVPRKTPADCDASIDCPGVVMWHWRPPSHPDQIVELCDEHAKDKDLSDLVDLRSVEVPW